MMEVSRAWAWVVGGYVLSLIPSLLVQDRLLLWLHLVLVPPALLCWWLSRVLTGPEMREWRGGRAFLRASRYAQEMGRR